MSSKPTLPTRRNPLVALALHRVAGRHGPSTKAQRQHQRTALRRELALYRPERPSP